GSENEANADAGTRQNPLLKMFQGRDITSIISRGNGEGCRLRNLNRESGCSGMVVDLCPLFLHAVGDNCVNQVSDVILGDRTTGSDIAGSAEVGLPALRAMPVALKRILQRGNH